MIKRIILITITIIGSIFIISFYYIIENFYLRVNMDNKKRAIGIAIANGGIYNIAPFVPYLGLALATIKYENIKRQWEYEKNHLLSRTELYYKYIVEGEPENKPTIIYDRKGRVIAIFESRDKIVVPFNEIPPELIKSIISLEDREFYNHSGINLFAIARAFFKNLIAGRVMEGGSTITQQLAKVLFTSQKRTISRKIFEFLAARELENRYSKKDILLMYLNTVYFGDGCYGVQDAARYYFGRDISSLNYLECAMLAGMIANPTLFSPLHNIEKAKKRHKTALYVMGRYKTSRDKYYYEEFWKRNEERFKKGYSRSFSLWKTRINRLPQLTEYVRRELSKYFTIEDIKKRGLKIYTAFDISYQKKALQVLRRGLIRNESILNNFFKKIDKLKGKKAYYRRLYKEIKPQSYSNQTMEGAIVAIDNKTGYVLALVGGRSYSLKNQFNRAISAKRQVGSSIKPFTYALAVDSNIIDYSTMLEDKRIDYNGWKPANYGNKKYGKISAYDALRMSVNTIAVQIMEKVGIDRFIKKIKAILFDDDISIEHNLSIALGTCEFTPFEMTRAYTIFPCGGRVVVPITIRRIEDSEGNILYDFENDARDKIDMLKEKGIDRVFSKEACYIITRMLQGVFAPGGTGYWAKLYNRLGIKCAGKTGTTSDYRDGWFVGYTKNITCGVWVGYDNNLSLTYKLAATVSAAPIWANFIKKTQIGPASSFEFEKPYGVVEVNVCLDSQKIANEYCTNVLYKAPFKLGRQPTEVCNIHSSLQIQTTNQNTNN